MFNAQFNRNQKTHELATIVQKEFPDEKRTKRMIF